MHPFDFQSFDFQSGPWFLEGAAISRLAGSADEGPDLPNRLTQQDASFLYGETASGPMHGSMISIVEGEVPFEDIYRHLESRLHLVPRYRQRLAFVPFNLAHAEWVDDPDFDLENHVIRHELPTGTTLEAAVDAALEVNEPLLDRDRPLWKWHVFEGVPGQTVLMQSFHHAMVDGVSGIDITMILFDLKADATQPPSPEEAWVPEPLPTPVESFGEAMKEQARALSDAKPLPNLGDSAKRSGLWSRGAATMMGMLTRPAIFAPWNSGSVGPKRKLAWSRYGFSEFREIRRSLGGTINDVVLTVVSEAAARYLKARGESVTDQHFRVMCPVSVRREEDGGALGNRVSGIFPMLPAWPMDVVDRHETVCEETGRIKENQEAQALEFMMESMPSLPPVAMAQTLLVGTAFDPTVFAARVPAPLPPRVDPRVPFFGINFTCTNVPGVQVPQYVAGHRILYNLGVLMLGGNLGFGVGVGSYNQEVVFNLVCEPRLLPDLELMRTGVDDSFSELLKEARNRASSARP